MNLFRSTATIGMFTLVSRILGMVRDILLARFLGAGPIADALFTAFRLPNLFRRVFAEGAFNAAFIPLYARRLEEDGEAAANDFAKEALSVLLVAVAVLVALFELSMPITMNLLGAGLSREPIQAATDNGAGTFIPYDLAVLYAQMTMPYLIFMSIAALFSGVLNTRQYFAVAAAAPIVLNLLLVGLLALAGPWGWSKLDIGLYLCAGMSLSGALQVALVVWGARRAGIKIGLKRPRLTPGVRRLFRLGLPGALAAGITQINLMVSHNIATSLAGAPSWLNYADRLYQLPLGMIGIAIGLALLPAITRALRGSDPSSAQTALNRGVELSMALTLPAAFALAVMPSLIVAGLFERGSFTATDTAQTAKALQMFALGLPAFVLIKVLTPAFFARENTRTPMVYAGISAVVNVIVGASLFFTVGFYGLALATSIAAWGNALMLLWTLMKSGDFAPDKRLMSRLPRFILASLIMGGGLYFAQTKAYALLGQNGFFDIGLLAIVSLAGLILYALCVLGFRALTPGEMKAALRR